MTIATQAAQTDALRWHASDKQGLSVKHAIECSSSLLHAAYSRCPHRKIHSISRLTASAVSFKAAYSRCPHSTIN